MAIGQNSANPRKFQKSQLKIYAVLIPVALVMIFPILYIVNHAFKPMEELFAYPPKFFVSNPSLSNFYKLIRATVTSNVPVARYLFNSIFITICVLVFTLTFTTMAAYALSKMNFKGRKFLLGLNDIGLMFVAIALQIPRYLIVDKLGIIEQKKFQSNVNNYINHLEGINKKLFDREKYVEMAKMSKDKVKRDSLRKEGLSEWFDPYMIGRDCDSTGSKGYPLVTELIYYKEHHFRNAWFVDNLGSFLVIIERPKH